MPALVHVAVQVVRQPAPTAAQARGFRLSQVFDTPRFERDELEGFNRGVSFEVDLSRTCRGVNSPPFFFPVGLLSFQLPFLLSFPPSGLRRRYKRGPSTRGTVWSNVPFC